MNYYIHENEQQHGPFSIEQLKASGITGETPVWCEGMAQWTTAKNVPELVEIIQVNINSTPPPFAQVPPTPPQPSMQQPTPPIYSQSEPSQPCPDNNLVISIIATVMTLFCCFPFSIGVVALVYSLNVESKWKRGDIDIAIQYAKNAKNWAIWSIVAAVAIPILALIFYIIFGTFLFSTFGLLYL